MSGKAISSLASLEKRNGDCEVRTVKVDKIDNYDFDDVDLIKIDVEGHEEYVIEGARNVIKKNMNFINDEDIFGKIFIIADKYP